MRLNNYYAEFSISVRPSKKDDKLLRDLYDHFGVLRFTVAFMDEGKDHLGKKVYRLIIERQFPRPVMSAEVTLTNYPPTRAGALKALKEYLREPVSLRILSKIRGIQKIINNNSTLKRKG